VRARSLRSVACAALFALSACAARPPDVPLTGIRFPETGRPLGVARSNADLAEDFIDLTFTLENGVELPVLLRHESPIRVVLTSPGLQAYRGDVDFLIGRLRTEAGLDIALTDDASRAQIHIEAVPARSIRRVFPTAACFIVPGVTSWSEFRTRDGDPDLRWSDQTELGEAAIFLPVDTAPQDVRDCLAEELTQALGPANDLYRLPDTVWNDDNFHGDATAFDMVMLRALYQPELRSGMTRDDVGAALPGVLDRVNPKGRGRPRAARAPESPEFADAIEAALSRDRSRTERMTAARDATRVAAEMKPVDHRLGVALLARGRQEVRRDPEAAVRDFGAAYQLFRTRLGLHDIRTAQAGVHLAAMSLATERYDVAIRLSDLHVPDALAARNAVLIAGYLSIKAAALAETDRIEEAREARLDSLRWARYGFGEEGGAMAREQARLAETLAAGDM
jgi:hypothetical protein